MKRIIIALLLFLVLLLVPTIKAQTFGSGWTVTGNTNALFQVTPGFVLTNSGYMSVPQKGLILSGISDTNETAIGYYGFKVPTNYYLMPGTTNVYVFASFTNSFASGTNNGTWSTNFPPINQQQISLPVVMGLSIGADTNTAYSP